MPDFVNREWKDLDDKWDVLKNGRITSCSFSIENHLEHFRSLGERTYRVVPVAEPTVSFSIDGHIINQNDRLYNTVKNGEKYSFDISTPKPHKRKYNRKQYEIMVKHEDGHFTQQTFIVPKTRIGKVPRKRRRASKLPK